MIFTTFNDWEFDGNVANAIENAKNFWSVLKAASAMNMRATVTGPNSIRTETLWSSKEEIETNLDKIRAAAGSAVGLSVTVAMQGNVVLELD